MTSLPARPPTRNPGRARINLGAEGDTPLKTVRFSREDAPNVIKRASPNRENTYAPPVIFNTPQRELAEMRRHRLLTDDQAVELTGSPTAQQVLQFFDDALEDDDADADADTDAAIAEDDTDATLDTLQPGQGNVAYQPYYGTDGDSEEEEEEEFAYGNQFMGEDSYGTDDDSESSSDDDDDELVYPEFAGGGTTDLASSRSVALGRRLLVLALLF